MSEYKMSKQKQLRAELWQAREKIRQMTRIGDAIIADEAVFYSQEQAEHYTTLIDEWKELTGGENEFHGKNVQVASA